MLFSPNCIYHKSNYQRSGRWLSQSEGLVWLQEKPGIGISHGLRNLGNAFQPQKPMWIFCLFAHIRYAVPTVPGPVPRITGHHVGNRHFLSPYRNALPVPASRSWELERGHLFSRSLHCEESFDVKEQCAKSTQWWEQLGSQSHRIAEVERDLWMSSGPTSHAQAGPPRPNCPGPFPDSFWKLAIYVSAWWSPQGGSQNFCVSVCAHGFWSSYWAPMERAWLCPLCTLPSDIYTHWWRPCWTFSSPGWTVTALWAFPHRRGAPQPSYSWLFVGVSLVLGSPGLVPALQEWPHQTWEERRGRITSLYLLATHLLMQPRTPFTFFALSAHCWVMINLVSTRTPRCFSANG